MLHVCHDRILHKLCKPVSPAFKNFVYETEGNCLCKSKRGLILWIGNMSGVQKSHKSGILYQKCQTYCMIFTLVSFLGNTLRMFKGCGKEETLFLKH